ncbi:MAG: ankyrin repeat domain-containing protein [Myxococcales bacterium]|nr:ankyrin repeat domain-containing protein [Myxococcales bacterium]
MDIRRRDGSLSRSLPPADWTRPEVVGLATEGAWIYAFPREPGAALQWCRQGDAYTASSLEMGLAPWRCVTRGGLVTAREDAVFEWRHNDYFEREWAPGGRITALACSDDAVFCATGGSIVRLPLRGGERIDARDAHAGSAIVGLAVAGDRLASFGVDLRLRIRDAFTLEELHEVALPRTGVAGAQTSYGLHGSQGRFVVLETCALWLSGIFAFDATTGALRGSLTTNLPDVRAQDAHLDDRGLLIATDGGLYSLAADAIDEVDVSPCPHPSAQADLNHACAAGDLAQIEAALSAGADLDLRDGAGTTPLWRAVETGNLKLVKSLLQRGAKATELDRQGRSIVALPARKEKLTIVKALVAAGADPEGSPLDGRATLDNVPSKAEKVRAFLVGAGAVVTSDQTLARRADAAELDLRFLPISDAGLASLRGARNLRRLNLERTQVGDAGMADVATLEHLEVLSLQATQVSDAGLAHLAGLTKLRELTLIHTLVTDAGLRHLHRTSSLRLLYAGGTRCTDEGIRALEQALPLLRVVR